MEKNVLVMIPGPTPVVKSIQEQMGREIQAFGDPRFVKDYKELIDELGTLFNCSGQTFPLAGTGTLAMEMAIANVTKRGDNVLIVSNGFFGDRFIEICERKGLQADVLSAEWGSAVSPEAIDRKLSEKDYAAVTVTHVDTSTAVIAPVAEIGKVMKKHSNTIFILDGVAATAGEFADVDGMGIDVMFTGSQRRSAFVRACLCSGPVKRLSRAANLSGQFRSITLILKSGSRSWRTRQNTSQRRRLTWSGR